jgi:hypothetical protein
MGSHWSFGRRNRYFIDRCRLFATAAMAVGVPALIYAGGLIGILAFGTTALAALIWTRRVAHAPLRQTFVRAFHEDDTEETDEDCFWSDHLEVVHGTWRPDFDDEDPPDADESFDSNESTWAATHPAFLSDDGSGDNWSHDSYVNPASGLPMISGNPAGVDVAGNPFGFSSDDFGSGSHSAMSSSRVGVESMGIGCDWP